MIEAAKLQSRLGYTTGIACLNEQAKVDVDALLGCFPGVYAFVVKPREPDPPVWRFSAMLDPDRW